MLVRLSLISICLLGALFSSAQDSFTVRLIPSSLTAAPATHSGAFATFNGKWVFVGGRIDGMHIMQTGQSFPQYGRNDSIFIVDPVQDSFVSIATTSLPNFVHGALCSANMQYVQRGQYLYLTGGYGLEDSTGTHMTFPSLISIDLNCLLNAANTSTSIDGCIRQLIDSNMAVAGGAMEIIDSTFYLVFGHRFDGIYAHPPSPLFFTQQYTHEIRKFTIDDDGVNLAISNYSAVSDTENFHRRDFNLVPQIFPNLEKGLTAFGGVFQKQIDRPFLTPIDITVSGYQHQTAFNENLNQYTSAFLPIFDSAAITMHNIFFGGISLFTYDTLTQALVEDTLIPFVSAISKVSRDSSGSLSESLMDESMPGFKGTNAVFIPDPAAHWFDGKISNLNALSGNTRVGYIAGGIVADQPNVAQIDPVGLSRPNAILYEVYIDKSVNAISEIMVRNDVNNLSVYPNPATGECVISFSLLKELPCTVSLYDSKGNLVRKIAGNKLLAGNQLIHFSVSGIANGIYACRVTAGSSVKTQLLRIENR